MKTKVLLGLAVCLVIPAALLLYSRLTVLQEVRSVAHEIIRSRELYAEVLEERESAWWFKEDYLTEAEDLRMRTRNGLTETKDLAVQAMFDLNPWRAKSLVRTAKTRAQAVSELATRTREAYRQLRVQRAEARLRYELLREAFHISEEKFGQYSRFFVSYRDQYRPQDAAPVEAAINSAEASLSSAGTILDRVSLLLPPDETHTWSGDPKRAMVVMDQTEEKLVKANTALAETEGRLDDLPRAASKAEAAVAAAKAALDRTWEQLKTAEAEFGIGGALKHVFRLYSLGADSFAHAVAVLTDPRERRDYLGARDSAEKALDLATRAEAELTEQLRASKYALMWLDPFESKEKVAEAEIAEAQRIFRLLELYHSRSAQEASAANIEKAKDLLKKGREEYALAQALYAEQEFVRSGEIAYPALATLGMARDEVYFLSKRLEQLEAKRAQWPQEYLAARNALAQTRIRHPLVDGASRYLDEAEVLASQRNWQEATDRAQMATDMIYAKEETEQAEEQFRRHLIVVLAVTALAIGSALLLIWRGRY